MRIAYVLVLVASTRIASADAPWAVDVGVRGIGSIAVDDAAMSRSGAAPSIVARIQRTLGPVFIGANLAAGLPAYLGEHEASVAIGLAHTLREGRCIRDLDSDNEQCDARLVLLGGVDAGVALFFYDAPPELSASSDAVFYWGPLARARAAFRATWPTPNGQQIGVTVGVGVAAVSARYMTTASGSGVRIEPGVDVAGVIAF